MDRYIIVTTDDSDTILLIMRWHTPTETSHVYSAFLNFTHIPWFGFRIRKPKLCISIGFGQNDWRMLLFVTDHYCFACTVCVPFFKSKVGLNTILLSSPTINQKFYSLVTCLLIYLFFSPQYEWISSPVARFRLLLGLLNMSKRFVSCLGWGCRFILTSA